MIAGLFASVCLLLVLAGGAKAAKPDETALALREMGVPSTKAVVRFGGAAEAALGLWALMSGSLVAASLVAISFVAFATWVLVALRRNLPISSCGCFGRPDTPPTWLHVAIDLAAAVVAIGYVASASPRVPSALAEQPAPALYVGLVALITWLAVAVLTALPPTSRRAR